MVHVENLHKTYLVEGRTVPAVQGVTFNISAGEVYTLLGPSGCGKSTVLRCIAGLEHPEEGEIRIGDQVAFSAASNISVPVYKRDIGMVFQSYAIWPHLDVFSNIAYPLIYGRKSHSKQEIGRLVEKSLSLVHMEGFGERSATLLSGGQQQRVALARALVYQPSLLLLDEPLSNLDARLRDEVRKEIKELVQSLHLTILYVTHDQVEALALSDRIAVMRDGAIVQEGSPEEIYLSPREPFVASFMGNANQISCVLMDNVEQGGLCSVETSLGRFKGMAVSEMSKGDEALFLMRPEAITLCTSPPGALENIMDGKIETVTFVGDSTECRIRSGDTLIDIKPRGLVRLQLHQQVYLHIRPEEALILKGDCPQRTSNE